MIKLIKFNLIKLIELNLINRIWFAKSMSRKRRVSSGDSLPVNLMFSFGPVGLSTLLNRVERNFSCWQPSEISVENLSLPKSIFKKKHIPNSHARWVKPSSQLRPPFLCYSPSIFPSALVTTILFKAKIYIRS